MERAFAASDASTSEMDRAMRSANCVAMGEGSFTTELDDPPTRTGADWSGDR
jgi:hypothetical protein